MVGANKFGRQSMDTYVIPRVSGGRLLEIGSAQEPYAGMVQKMSAILAAISALDILNTRKSSLGNVTIGLGLLRYLNDGEIINSLRQSFGTFAARRLIRHRRPCVTQERVGRLSRLVTAKNIYGFRNNMER